jgi:hypothetical protein
MLHCPLKSDIKWKNPDGIFPDGLDMVRHAAKFKPSEDPPGKSRSWTHKKSPKDPGRGLTGMIDMALETARGCKEKRQGRDRSRSSGSAVRIRFDVLWMTNRIP